MSDDVAFFAVQRTLGIHPRLDSPGQLTEEVPSPSCPLYIPPRLHVRYALRDATSWYHDYSLAT